MDMKECTLMHKSGVKFNVFLTSYELQRANEGKICFVGYNKTLHAARHMFLLLDVKFAGEIVEKYYKLYKNGLVYGKENSASSVEIPLVSVPEKTLENVATSSTLLEDSLCFTDEEVELARYLPII